MPKENDTNFKHIVRLTTLLRKKYTYTELCELFDNDCQFKKNFSRYILLGILEYKDKEYTINTHNATRYLLSLDRTKITYYIIRENTGNLFPELYSSQELRDIEKSIRNGN